MNAREAREQHEERREIERRRREHGQYFDLSSPEKIRAAAEIAAAERGDNDNDWRTPWPQ